ncbi:hypothetical protein BV25DRAFT_1872473 [Artomyces pyxidatus]|uniref:Uncharacterized protein n=1 Tax=Artomyces pyxidatus TaxID=48021 RepID=A0ACB8SKU9_9AGAM|nr:hypothetical protein BV25DRAFT_1872473 [Artomyces pyxidatus]
MDSLQLFPPLHERGKEKAFVQSGRTLSATQSPRDSSLAVFATNAVEPKALSALKTAYPTQQDVYTASIDLVPSSERRLFITDTSVIFAAFQNLMKTVSPEDTSLLSQRDERTLGMMTKLALDYVNFTRECWVHASQPVKRVVPLQYDAAHYRSLYTCLSLFVVLYLPDSGFEDAPVGEELMEWLNIHFIEPSSEEGDLLSSQSHPWEDENFWPYLTKTVLRGLSKASVFFLNTLSQHQSEHLQDLAERLAPILESHPRLIQFSTERDFVVAFRRWKEKVKSLRLELDRVPEDVRHDDFADWWNHLSGIVGILEGRQEVIRNICVDLGSDWKEVCSAWGVFIDHRLRRQDLPDVVSQIMQDMPPDPTDIEDMIHAALFSGQLTGALSRAAKLDVWLAAHWADMMEPLELLDARVDEESELSVRQQYVLAYAQYLHSDPALWRITVDYLCSCGPIGRERADQVLLRVPFNSKFQGGHSPIVAEVQNGGLRSSDDAVGVLNEVIRTCTEYERESARRMVSQIAAQKFLQEKQYGLAISYAASAEYWTGVGRIVDSILTEYVLHGPEAFAQSVITVAPILQELRAHPDASGIFIHRLMFAVRYAEYHRRRLNGDLHEAALDLLAMLQEDIAPKTWWGVILCDAAELLKADGTMLFSPSGVVQLLKRLEEVHIRAAQGSGSDYLSVLMKTMKGATEKEALQRLRSARLALAKSYARCTMLGAGGREIPGPLPGV